ncbi:hypothetical protein Esti_003847 [Eimeria stiedai]
MTKCYVFRGPLPAPFFAWLSLAFHHSGQFFWLFFLQLSASSSLGSSEAGVGGSISPLPSRTSAREGLEQSAASLPLAAEEDDATLTDARGSIFASVDAILDPSNEGTVESQQQDAAAAAAAPAALVAAQQDASGGDPPAAAGPKASRTGVAALLRRRVLGTVLLLALMSLGVVRAFSKPREEERPIDDQTERALLVSLERLEELVQLLRPAQQLAEQLSNPDASKALWDFTQHVTDAEATYTEFLQHRLPAALAIDALEPALASAGIAAWQLQRMARIEATQFLEDMEKAAASLEPLSKPVIDLLESMVGKDYAWGLSQFLDSLKDTAGSLMQRSQEVYFRVSHSNKLLTAATDLRFLEEAASHMVFAVTHWQEALEDATKITRNILVRSVASKSRSSALVFAAQQGALEEAVRQLAAQEEAAEGEDDESRGERQQLRRAINRSFEVLDKSHKLLKQQKLNLDALQAKNKLNELLIAFQASEVASISVENSMDSNAHRFETFPLLRGLFYRHLEEGFRRRAEETRRRAPATLHLASILRETMHAELGGFGSMAPPPKYVSEELFKCLVEAADDTLGRAHKAAQEAVTLAHAISIERSGKRLSELVSRANGTAELVDEMASHGEKLFLTGRLLRLLEMDMQESGQLMARASAKKISDKELLAALESDFDEASLDAGGLPDAAQISDAAARMRLAAHYMFLITSGVALTPSTQDQQQ